MTEVSANQHPLGPLISMVPLREGTKGRSIAVLVLVGTLTLLGVALWVEPDSSGLGTHRQLGFPACTSITLTGYPCPTCGMTTAFSHTVRGQLPSAFMAQPAGLLLALMTILIGVLSLLTITTGQIATINWYRLSPTWVVLLFLAVILLAWLFKIMTGRTTGVLPIA